MQILKKNSLTSDEGKPAIIPIIMINEIPLPKPLSVIFSPNHIANIVPVTKMITEDIINKGPRPRIKALSGTPNAESPYR